MKPYFDAIVAGIEDAVRQDPACASPGKKRALEVARLGSRLYSGDQEIAWCGVCAPFELLSAMGITSCFVEFVGAAMAAAGEAALPALDAAEQAGYGPDACGYHRSVLGATQIGAMPKPRFLIATSTPCTGGLAVVEELARHFERELFVLQVPLGSSDSEVAFVVEQLRSLIRFVEQHTGEALSDDRLRQAMVLANAAREKLVQVYELAAHVPSPATSREMANLALLTPLFFGTEIGVEIAESYREALSDRTASQQWAVPDERLRLMWIQNRIQFRNPLIETLERDHGAAVVADELNVVYWDAVDPDDPLPGIARRMIEFPFNGPIERRIKNLRQLAGRYQIDGAINPCHWGCRQGAGARGIIAEELRDDGVPVLNLEVDCADPRNFSAGQLTTRLQAFVELLETKAARKR